jgi:hypothetical protein
VYFLLLPLPADVRFHLLQPLNVHSHQWLSRDHPSPLPWTWDCIRGPSCSEASSFLDWAVTSFSGFQMDIVEHQTSDQLNQYISSCNNAHSIDSIPVENSDLIQGTDKVILIFLFNFPGNKNIHPFNTCHNWEFNDFPNWG